MKKIGFVTNINRDTDMSVTHNLMDQVRSLGCETIELPNGIPSDMHLDFIIVLGGDGTMLAAARDAVRVAEGGVPLLGINLGRVGFLTDAEENNGSVAVKKLLAGKFKVEKRMMLEAVILSENLETEAFLALNDIVAHRGQYPKPIYCSLDIDGGTKGGKFFGNFRGDGVIVATPTGSTAYNRSAGGEVLQPQDGSIAITPICPQVMGESDVVPTDTPNENYTQSIISAGVKPMSVPGNKTIIIGLENSPQTLITADGVFVHRLGACDEDFIQIRIRAAKQTTQIIRTNTND
jgi:NAD+ kinase